jgi:hypothetical protein
MNAYLADIIATERISELRREADAVRLAAEAPRHSRAAEVVRWLSGRWSVSQHAVIHWRRTA